MSLEISCAAWQRAVDYAMNQASKKWDEEGDSASGPDMKFWRQWLAYYLAQQWMCKFPDGGLFGPDGERKGAE